MLCYSLICMPFDFGPSLKETYLSIPFLKSNLIGWHGLFSYEVIHSSVTYCLSLYEVQDSYYLWYLRTGTYISE